MITKIRIRNFRSFEDTTVRLKPFNVLIGPNDSGKSNFLDAFRVLSGMMWSKLDDVFSGLFDSFNAVLFQGLQNKTISFDVEAKTRIGNQQESFEFEYSVKISQNKKGTLHIPTEKLKIKRERDSKAIQYINRSGEVTEVKEETSGKKRIHHFDSDRCAISLLSDIKKHAYIRSARWGLGFCLLYEFQPHRMKFLTERKAEEKLAILDGDGSNLREVLFYLQEKEPAKFKKLINSLKDAIPSVEDLKIIPLEKWLVTELKQHYNGKLFDLNMSNISDGLLRFLAILSLVYNPTFPTSIFMFEELENGIHPRRLRTVIDLMLFISSGSHPTQIIITTHSPYLIDCVTPKDVLVVDRSASTGATTIKSIEKKKGISKLLDEFSLGEAWFSGELGGVP